MSRRKNIWKYIDESWVFMQVFLFFNLWFAAQDDSKLSLNRLIKVIYVITILYTYIEW